MRGSRLRQYLDISDLDFDLSLDLDLRGQNTTHFKIEINQSVFNLFSVATLFNYVLRHASEGMFVNFALLNSPQRMFY